MDRRSFVTGIAGGIGVALVAPSIWLEEPKHPAYRAACAAAGVPLGERGNVYVVEVLTVRKTQGLAIPGHHGYRIERDSWEARRFEEVKAGDVFRIVSPKGYDCDPKTGTPICFRADTDAQQDPNNPYNAGLTGERLATSY